MRVAVYIPDRHLRAAIEQLLARAGHTAVPLREADTECKLRILSVPVREEAPAGVATLYLRPPPGLRAHASPAAALRGALENGGVAVWSAPLDPNALVQALGSGQAIPVTEASPVAAGLEGAPACWLLVEPRGGSVLWGNAAARSRWSLDGEQPDLARLTDCAPLDVVEERIAWQTEGVLPITTDERKSFAVWWTELRGRRLLGLIEPDSREDGEERRLAPLAEIGRMAATMAHEIRNPVASVASALDLMEGEPDPVERREIAKLARGRLQDMRALLDDILRFARPIDDPPEAVDAWAAVESAVALVAAHPDVKGVVIRAEPPAEPVEVEAHPEPLRQAITNLLINAAQAQGGRGVVDVSVGHDGKWGVIRVRDEGPGIPQAVRDRMYEPFYTTKKTGTGLGLAFVREVMRAGHGRIELEDVPRGTCFRLSLRSHARNGGH